MFDDQNTQSMLQSIAIGACVGLLVGFGGILLPPGEVPSFIGGMFGAVAGGAAAAYVSDSGLVRDTIVALFADLTSSVVFFFLVIGGLGVSALSIDAASVLTAIVGSIYVGLWGLVFAIPIAMVSVVIAVLSGATTSLTRRVVRARRA